MNDDSNDQAAQAELRALVQDHADLDAAVQALALMPMPDMMTIGRLKRKKLILKDLIAQMKDELTPDIIA